VAPAVYSWLEGFLFDPSLLPEGVDVKLTFSNFADAFFLRLKISFVIGLIGAAPLILWEMWGFVRPGLRRQERLAVRSVAPVSVALFLAGVVFAFFILKPAFRWFVSYLEDFQGAALYQQPGAFAVFILKMVLAFGVGFQMPVIVWFLAKVELLSSESLLRNWRIAVVVIVAVSAFLTPSGDFFSLAMMSTPLVVLYFGGIVAARITERRRLKGR
jgi:sec-independent protein translocase protein TatC